MAECVIDPFCGVGTIIALASEFASTELYLYITVQAQNCTSTELHLHRTVLEHECTRT